MAFTNDKTNRNKSFDRDTIKKLKSLSTSDLVILRWHLKRRDAQTCPEPIPSVWWLLGGRAAGKTYTASNHIYEYSASLPFVEDNETVYIALIGSIFDDVRNTMIEGKALALDTPVVTPEGMVPIGDLKEGSVVLGGNGLSCEVTNAWDVRYDRSCYEITFKGGIKVVADAEHQWVTEDCKTRHYNARYNGNRTENTVTTEEIYRSLRHFSGKASQANHAVRVCTVEAPEVELPLDPYLFGVWLGDGKTNGAEVTTMDFEIVKSFEDFGFEPRIRKNSGQGLANTYGFLGLSKILRQMGMFTVQKWVPEPYMLGSQEQRLALLQGLMDTDGTVSTRGQCSFSNNNLEIHSALIRVATSLGIKASTPKIKKGTKNYITRFTTTLPVFRLDRKLDRIPQSERDGKYWYILDIKPVESVPVRCISVNSPDNTYLITEHHVKTHNSGLLKIVPEEDLLKWNRTNGELSWRVIGPNGEQREVQCNTYTSEKPDKLRGPNLHMAWIDEYAKFKDANDDPRKAGTTWRNMTLCLRNGTKPHAIVTGTPTDCRLSKYLLEHPGMKMSLMTSLDNRDNLPDSYIEELMLMDPNSRTYRQEVLAELIFDNPDAIFAQDTMDNSRAAIPDDADPVYRVLGYDPSMSSSTDADECGIILTAYTPEVKEKSKELGGRPRIVKPTHAYILKDLSGHYTPHEQTQLVIQTILSEGVNDLVYEQNQGVEFVMASLEQALKDNALEYNIRKNPKGKKTDYGIVKRWTVTGIDLEGQPIKFMIYAVHATSQKKLRAEMVSTRYDSGQIHHPPVGAPPLATCEVNNCRANLESQMTSWDPKNSKYSPDRLDAMAYTMLHIFANFMITKSKVTIARPDQVVQRNSQHQAVRTRRKSAGGIYSSDLSAGNPTDTADRRLLGKLEMENPRRNPYE